jgi:hypothetical protein
MSKLLRVLAPLTLAVFLVAPMRATTGAQAPAQGGAARGAGGAIQTISARTTGLTKLDGYSRSTG